jgi:DNA-binding transcriptional LysR family regulator
MFMALVRHSTLTAAARSLFVSHATVGRRITSLERTVGQKLIERRADGYVLTRAGHFVLNAAHDMEIAAERLARADQDQSLIGLVRIGAPLELAQRFLTEPLSQLAINHHGLDVEIVADSGPISLERREADVLLQFGPPLRGDLVGRKIMEMQCGLYATSAWIHRLDEGDRPVFIGANEADSHVGCAGWLSHQFPSARFAFRTNSIRIQADAAKAGVGIALLPHFIGRSHGLLLVKTLQREQLPSHDLWIVTRKQDHTQPLIEAVEEHLLMMFDNERGAFGEGEP